MSDEKNKNLLNIKNYNNTLENIDNVIHEYNNIINEYLIHIVNQIIIKDTINYKFIIHRGLDLLKNIFITLLFYTRNLNLVAYHVRKSYLYYTEFIGQVGEDSNSFLQLNSKDACLFVYKKTLYDINEDIKKKIEYTENEKKKNYILKECLFLHSKIIRTVITLYMEPKNLLLTEHKESFIKHIRLYMNKISNELTNMFNNEINKQLTKNYNDILDNDYFMKINNFLIYIDENKEINLNKKQEIIYFFIKKIINHNISILKINELILNEKNITLTAIKYVNKLFRSK